MLEHVAVFVLGLTALVKGSDLFVETVAKLARKLGVSDFIIGLTVTAIGTSIPELFSAVSAALQQAPELVTGNVIGSNIANIGLILGISALIASFKTDQKMYDRDGYFLLFSVLLFFYFAYDQTLVWWEGLIMLALYVMYVLFLLRTKEDSAEDYKFHDFLAYMFDYDYMATIRSLVIKKAMDKTPSQRTKSDRQVLGLFKEGIVKDVILGSISLALIIGGAHFFIKEAIFFAELLDMPRSIIGMTIIAIGTSLPEVMVALSAARKGHGNIIVGNILGSNIANTLLIIGMTALLGSIPISMLTLQYTLPILGFFSLGLLYFIKHNWDIERAEGAVALSSYVLFLIIAVILGL